MVFSNNMPAGMRNLAANAENVQNVALAFTITGLSQNVRYRFDMEAKNGQSETIDSTHGYFETSGTTDINTTNSHPAMDKIQKVLINGQIYILRGDKTYTLQGQEVK